MRLIFFGLTLIWPVFHINVQKEALKTNMSFFTLILFFSLICFRNVRIYYRAPVYTGHESSLWQVLMAFTMTEIHPTFQSLLLVWQREIAIKYTKNVPKKADRNAQRQELPTHDKHRWLEFFKQKFAVRKHNRDHTIAKNHLNKHESGIRNIKIS